MVFRRTLTRLSLLRIRKRRARYVQSSALSVAFPVLTLCFFLRADLQDDGRDLHPASSCRIRSLVRALKKMFAEEILLTVLSRSLSRRQSQALHGDHEARSRQHPRRRPALHLDTCRHCHAFCFQVGSLGRQDRQGRVFVRLDHPLHQRSHEELFPRVNSHSSSVRPSAPSHPSRVLTSFCSSDLLLQHHPSARSVLSRHPYYQVHPFSHPRLLVWAQSDSTRYNFRCVASQARRR